MSFGEQYAAVALVMCLLGTTLWWLRRRGYSPAITGRRTSRRLEAMERLQLGPQHSLHLVRMGQTLAVVSCSPGGCSILQALPDSENDSGGRA